MQKALLNFEQFYGNSTFFTKKTFKTLLIEFNFRQKRSTYGIQTFVTDYDYVILGNRDSSNKVFSLRYAFLSNSTKVFLNGIRLTPGVEYDYIEVQPNKIEFSTAPFDNDFITVDYKAT